MKCYNQPCDNPPVERWTVRNDPNKVYLLCARQVNHDKSVRSQYDVTPIAPFNFRDIIFGKGEKS